MPFKSIKQERFMFAKHPEIAKRFAAETPDQSKLPMYSKLHQFFDGGKVEGEKKHWLVNPSGSDRGLFSEAEEKAIQEQQDRENLPQRKPAQEHSKHVETIPGGYLEYQKGGKVPGMPKLPGNHPENDTVDTKLSPGEVVLPNSVTQQSDAPERAKRFMKLHHYFGGHK